MKFSINQIIEVVDGKPVILSTDIRVLSSSDDLYSLARDYIEEHEEYKFIQRSQYSGYKCGKRYDIVLIPQQDRLIICSNEPSSHVSKLFPYLWETDIKTVEELHTFFENWNK
jgi:hypothetical protein